MSEFTLDDFGNYYYKNEDHVYEDGIMNNSLFCSEKIKLLWILRETNGNFNPKNWWGRKEYENEKLNSFDGVKKKGSLRHTWESVARISFQILNSFESDDDYELAACLERIAIINLKKTPGKEKTNKEYDEYLSKECNREIFVKQLKRINPDIIICGNTLNNIKSSEINYRKGKRIVLNTFSDNSKFMKRNSCFCFSNKLFINPYHPSNVMNKNEYVKIVVSAYQNWLKIHNKCPVFNW